MTEIEKAMRELRKELNKDKSEGSYYHGWICNLTMAIRDGTGGKITKKESRECA